jgi:SLT domain-containing protein
VEPLKILAQKESSLDPAAVNPTPVGNEHATGLMQTLPSTFNSYALNGYGDIYNPVDNLIASIGYISSRYGHPWNALNGWEERGGY